MPGADLQTKLTAILAHVGCTRDELCQSLLACARPNERFAPSTFSDVFNGKRKETRKAKQVTIALEAYVKTIPGLSLDEVVRTYASQRHPVSRPGYRSVSSALSGAWFFIQFRGKRYVRADRVAKADYRFAILIYGEEEATGRSFQIIGETTVWRGHVSMHPKDELLYYSGQEMQRGEVEWVRMLMHAPFTEGDTADHHGIVLGIARGQHDAPDYPIYASRVLLSRIEIDREKGLVAPISDPAQIARLRRYCSYSNNPQEFEDNDPLKNERDRAVRSFVERADEGGNHGDRIFVRS